MQGVRVSVIVMHLMVSAGGLSAQTHVVVDSGTRARVTVAGTGPLRLEGTVAMLHGDSLVVVGASSTWRGRLDSVAKLEVSHGRRSYSAAGMLIGTLVGLGVGVAIGLSGDDSPPLDVQDQAAIYAILLGPVGGGIGAIVGAHIKTERWVEVPIDRVRVRPMATVNGSIGLRASVSF